MDFRGNNIGCSIAGEPTFLQSGLVLLTAKDSEDLELKKVSEVISMKDFFNHDTRITLLENAIINIDRRFEQVDRRFEQIDKRFEQVDKRFEQVDRRFEKLENKIDSHFKWVIGCIGMLSLTTISTLVTMVTMLSRHTT